MDNIIDIITYCNNIFISYILANRTYLDNTLSLLTALILTSIMTFLSYLSYSSRSHCLSRYSASSYRYSASTLLRYSATLLLRYSSSSRYSAVITVVIATYKQRYFYLNILYKHTHTNTYSITHSPLLRPTNWFHLLFNKLL